MFWFHISIPAVGKSASPSYGILALKPKTDTSTSKRTAALSPPPPPSTHTDHSSSSSAELYLYVYVYRRVSCGCSGSRPWQGLDAHRAGFTPDGLGLAAPEKVAETPRPTFGALLAIHASTSALSREHPLLRSRVPTD